jgi:hypothetical protein
MKYLMGILASVLLVTPVWAVDTAVTYSSGILVMLFIGFCALLIVAQLIPAVLVLFGIAKAVQPRKLQQVKN